MQKLFAVLLVPLVGYGTAIAGGTDAAYQKLASEINASLPATLDKNTRADNVTVTPGPVFTYNLTIVSANARDIDAAALIAKLRPTVTAGACSNPDMRVIFKDKVTVRYSYRGADGAFIARFDVTPTDCGLGR